MAIAARVPEPDPNEERSARGIINEVFRPNERIDVLADECVAVAISADEFDALPLAAQEALVEGFDSLLRHYRRIPWRSGGYGSSETQTNSAVAPPRSGHKNSSGRFRGLTTGTSILHEYVYTLDGEPHRIGDLDLETTTRLRDEYQRGENGYAKGRKFFEALVAELTAKKKKTVEQLGVKRVKALQEDAGFRT